MINDLKKVELHVHLDGSVRPNTVSNLLHLNISDVKNKMIVDQNNQNLTEYLTKFDLPLSVMQTRDNLTRIAYELALDLKKDNVIYAEVRFAPQLHQRQNLSINEVVESVLNGINMVSGIKINLLLCMMRGAKDNLNREAIDIAYKYQNRGVCGVDLAGDEVNYPTIDYASLFAYANELGIPFTIHAGEASGAKSVSDAISFGAKRIGHGIMAIEDKRVIDSLKTNNITLEVCPTSNVQTKAVTSYSSHPIKKLIDMGVSVTINTDNRTVSNITLNQEYKLLMDTFGFNESDFKQFNINAINASFLSELDKKELISKVG